MMFIPDNVLSLYLVHAVLLSIPVFRLLGRVGRTRWLAALAFLPLVGRFACALLFGATRWPLQNETRAQTLERRAVLFFALVVPLVALAVIVVASAGLVQAYRSPGDVVRLGITLPSRDVFFAQAFVLTSALISLVLFYIWGLWRGCLLVCRRTGHADIWALYIFVPGINLMLPWILHARDWPDFRGAQALAPPAPPPYLGGEAGGGADAPAAVSLSPTEPSPT